MNIVYLSSMSKAEEDRIIGSQVIIFEQDGGWQLVWNEHDEVDNLLQECWYEGDDKEKLATVYAEKVASKKAEGFAHIVTHLLEGGEEREGKLKLVRLLEYFSELNFNADVLDNLKKWRRAQAFKENRSAYMLATNKVLQMIATFLPQSTEELLQIPGFGPQKVERYGSAIFEITTNLERKTTFPLAWVSKQVDTKKFQIWMELSKANRMKAAFERKVVKRSVMEHISTGCDLGTIQTALKLTRRDLMQFIEELAKEGNDVTQLLDAELNKVESMRIEAAKEGFKEYGDQYLKPVLRKVYSEEELKEIKTDQAYEWLRMLRLLNQLDRQAIVHSEIHHSEIVHV